MLGKRNSASGVGCCLHWYKRGRWRLRRAASPRSSPPAAVAGYPAITVPAGYTFGLPIGITFFGRRWSEPLLIKLAYAFEQGTRARMAPEQPPVGRRRSARNQVVGRENERTLIVTGDALRRHNRRQRLAQRFDATRLERACARALAAGDGRYQTVRGILERGLEDVPLEEAAVPRSDGAYLRGAAAFSEAVR